MHNLRTVIKFEVLKQIRKPLFWVAIFAFPVMMIVFGGISYLSTKLSMDQGEKAKEQTTQIIKKIIVVDETKLVDSKQFAGLTTEFETDKNQTIEKFRTSTEKAALIIYPKNIPEAPIAIYTKTGKDKAETQQISIGMEALATSALQASVESKINNSAAAILKTQSLPKETHIVNEKGQDYNPFSQMIVPGIFLVVFFLVFVLTGNQTLVATTEEKENRVAEMILTTVKAQTLIVGKIIALVALGFIQITALLTPIILSYFVAIKYFSLPPLINNILQMATFEFWPVFFGAALLLFGFLLLTGFTILAGSLFPTAQDAAQFYTPIVLGQMLPFYFIGAITTGAGGMIVKILSFFPLSAPLTLLIRNMAGNLPLHEGLIGLAVVILSSVVVMVIAVKAFKKGVFEYSKPASFKDAFKRAR